MENVSGMHPSRTVQRTGHGACLARRLIAGAGLLSLTPYANPEVGQFEVLAHHWSPICGRIAVAYRSDGEGWPTIPGQLVDVRLQIEKLALLPAVRILAASLHALGSMEVVVEPGGPTPVPQAIDLGPLADVAGDSGVWIAAVHAPKLLLHRSGQVEQHELVDVMNRPGFPNAVDELGAMDMMLGFGELAMARLAATVLDGTRPGESARVNAPQAHCGHLQDRVFPVDVSGHGVTMLLTGHDGAGLVTVDFRRPVTGSGALHRALAELFASV